MLCGDVVQLRALKDIVEMTIENLRELKSAHCADASGGWYGQVLLAYFMSDIDKLKKLINEIGFPLVDRSLFEISRMRLALCDDTVDLAKVELLNQALRNESDRVILGEGHFVLSSAWSALGCPSEAWGSSETAAEYFDGLVLRKALRARLNALVEESRLHPGKRYIADYLYFAKRASDLGELTSAATCHYNISCEFRKIGAYVAALKFVERSLGFLSQNLAGRQYYEVLAHRCQLYVHLEYKWEARADFETLMASPFSETRDTALILARMHPELKTKSHESAVEPASENPVNPNWAERVRMMAVAPLGELEESLIACLLNGPIDRVSLVKKIYGEKLPFMHAENRLKNLLNRTRKKVPNLIVTRQGRYELQLDSETAKKSDLIHT